MLYYKVKPAFDQTYFKRKFSVEFLVAGELYTPAEIRTISGLDINKVFEIVEISRKKIYWFFGARFAAD